MPSMKLRGYLSMLPLVIISLAVLMALWLADSPATVQRTYAATLPPLPSGWPTTLQLGAGDAPGGAAAMKSVAPYGFRYQYLAGGVNTGNGWANWNDNGNFVTYYIQDSVASSITPVFTYYMMFQSQPGVNQGEATGVYNNMQNLTTMTAYWNDVKLFFQRAGAFSSPVVFHVEPDLWGYLEQRTTGDNATTVPAQVASTGLSELAGLPNNVSGFAKAFVKLRDTYAPNVKLGYHISVWGTGTDITLSNPSDSQVDTLATKASNYYNSLSANFDIAFAEFTDRDAAFKQYIYGDGGASWWDAGDFARHARFLGKFSEQTQKRVVLWQIPLGNTKMRAQDNTWGHYQDNHVEWLLDDASRANLSSFVQAGVVAFLFGGGASGTTCACDATNDGVTNPAPINGNTGVSLNADDDGGFFKQKVVAYYSQGAMSLSAGSGTPATATATATTAASTPTRTPTSVPATSTTVAATPTTPAGGQTTLGKNSIGAQLDTGDANFMDGSRFTTSSLGGTATSISAYIGPTDAAPRNQYQMAIYTNSGNAPGTLVASTASGTLTPNAWNTLPISASLAANTSYWLMYNTNSGSSNLNNMRYDTGPGPSNYKPQSYGAWPSNYGSGFGSPATFSIYLTYSSGVAPTATRTSTPVAATSTAAAASTATRTPVPGAATRTPTRTRTPTVTRTATRTSTPVAGTATRTVVPGSWTVSGSRSPASVARGGTEQVNVTITSGSTRSALIDVEIYAPDGSKAYQNFMDNSAFTAGVPRTFTQVWQVPANAATGTYTVKVGIFSNGWGTLYQWENSLMTFSVN